MQQFSAMAARKPFWVCATLALMSSFLFGCRKEEIKSYSVPKEVLPSIASKMPTTPAASPQTPLRWKTPAGWEELPASGMRVASFAVNKDGQRVDISIIPLAGVSGSELDNVNRWRGQVGLAPIDLATLGTAAEKVTVGGTMAAVYDLAGTDPQTKQPARIVGSMIPGEGTTWFFKMTGPDALVAEQKAAFKELLSSIQVGAGAGAGDVVETPRPVSTNVKEIPGSSKDEKPTWTVPPGWQEQPASSMRLASFLVKGENGAKADVSVIKLSGQAGGNLANINRWRSQIGLAPVDEAELQKLTTVREAGGSKVTFVDMTGRSVESGEAARLLAAIAPRNGVTWFYKMMGSDSLVALQKPPFIQFVETARYPNAP